jgi:hypothetical protein
MENTNDIRRRLIDASRKAVEHLIAVAKEDIIKHDEAIDLAADKLKNAAQAKRIAIFDAFDILARIDAEEENLNMLSKGVSKVDTKLGFAERRSK